VGSAVEVRPVNDCKQHEKHARAFGQSRASRGRFNALRRAPSRSTSRDPAPTPSSTPRGRFIHPARARSAAPARRCPRRASVRRAARAGRRPFVAPRDAVATPRRRPSTSRASDAADGATDRDVPTGVPDAPSRARSPSTRRRPTRKISLHRARASRPPVARARRDRASRSSRPIAPIAPTSDNATREDVVEARRRRRSRPRPRAARAVRNIARVTLASHRVASRRIASRAPLASSMREVTPRSGERPRRSRVGRAIARAIAREIWWRARATPHRGVARSLTRIRYRFRPITRREK